MITTRSGNKYFKKEEKKENFEKKKDHKKGKEFKKKKDLMELDDEFKVKKTKGQSRFDRIESYDIGKDLMNTKVNITFAQLTQIPKLERQMKDCMKRKTYSELKKVEESDEQEERSEIGKEKATAIKCKVIIKGKKVKVTIDTRAASSIISKDSMENLGIKIEKNNRKTFKVANGNKMILMGEVKVKMRIRNVKLPTLKVNIIDSGEEDLLIGANWCE